MGFDPFLIEPRGDHVLIRNEVEATHRLTNLGEQQSGCCGVEPHVLVEIELAIVGIDGAVIEVDRAAIARSILRIKRGGISAHEGSGPLEHGRPQ